jgi:hypothetical protein
MPDLVSLSPPNPAIAAASGKMVKTSQGDDKKTLFWSGGFFKAQRRKPWSSANFAPKLFVRRSVFKNLAS